MKNFKMRRDEEGIELEKIQIEIRRTRNGKAVGKCIGEDIT